MVGLAEEGVSMAAIQMPLFKKITMRASDASAVQRHLRNTHSIQVWAGNKNCHLACRTPFLNDAYHNTILSGPICDLWP